MLFHISWIRHFVCVHTVECGALDLQVTVGHTEAAFLWLLIRAGCSVLRLVVRLTPWVVFVTPDNLVPTLPAVPQKYLVMWAWWVCKERQLFEYESGSKIVDPRYGAVCGNLLLLHKS